jgi:hypothetical protein
LDGRGGIRKGNLIPQNNKIIRDSPTSCKIIKSGEFPEHNRKLVAIPATYQRYTETNEYLSRGI